MTDIGTLSATEAALPDFRYTEPGDEAFPRQPRQDRVPPRPVFDVDRLAVYFGVPGLSRDIHPAAPWVGVERPRPAPPRPAGTSDPGELRERLEAAVRRAVGAHETVAVALSGGMDSAVLLDLAARVCRQDGRRLVAVTLDITDDIGRRAGTVAAGQIEFLRAGAEHVRVAASLTRWPAPPWLPVGPRFDAWPRWHHGLVMSAAEHGATVVLQGAGSDQLLQTPAYLDRHRGGSGRARKAYRADAPDRSAIGGLMSATGRVRGALRANLYWAAAWPGFTTDRGAPLLHDDRRAAVEHWLRAFQRESIVATARARPTWAEATVMHRMFPYDILDDVGPVPTRMPFLDPEFARYAYDLPMWSRFSPELPSAYLRSKALVMGMLPEGFDTVVAHTRQRFYKTYRRYWQAVSREPSAAVELELVRPDWQAHCRDSFDLAMVMNVEDWIDGARERGATALRH